MPSAPQFGTTVWPLKLYFETLHINISLHIVSTTSFNVLIWKLFRVDADQLSGCLYAGQVLLQSEETWSVPQHFKFGQLSPSMPASLKSCIHSELQNRQSEKERETHRVWKFLLEKFSYKCDAASRLSERRLADKLSFKIATLDFEVSLQRWGGKSGRGSGC